MSVNNGQPVNAAVTNAGFLSRITDSDTVAKVGLKNTDSISGANINNAQRAINKAFEGVGATGEADTAINTYSSANYISNGDNRKVAVGKLDTQLLATQTQLAALDAINSQDVSPAAIGSTPNANGFTVGTNQVVNLEPANASFGGVVTTSTQTFSGDKTFANNVNVSGNEVVTGTLSAGASTLASLGVTGNETVGGTLGVTGETTLSSLGVTGSATVGGTLGTTGLATLNSATVTNNASIGGTLSVTGNTTLNGNLTVNGTTTTVNSTTVDAVDPNITVNKSGNNASSEGAGFTVDRTGTKGSLIYANASPSRFKAGDLGSEIELVNLSSTQTLTNKTLTAPAISSPTGITKSDVGLGNVDNTSDATKNSATATLTNKTISGTSNTITNVSLTTGVTGTLPIANGGTGQTTQAAAFNALSPISAKGDIIVNNGTDDVALAVGTNNFVLTADSTTATGIKWAAATGATTADYSSILSIQNLGITATVATNALTINITQFDGSTPSTGTAAVKVGMRSSTLTSGVFNLRSLTSALSLVVSSGSTLGHSSGVQHGIYVYLIDNAGTLELAVSQVLLDETKLITTVAEGGAGAADSNNVMYSATARTNVPFRVVGKILSTQTTAGTWASAPTNIILGSYGILYSTENILVRCLNTAGTSITNSGADIVVPFATKDYDTHNTFVTDTFTAPIAGKYKVSASVSFAGSLYAAGNQLYLTIYKNGSLHSYGLVEGIGAAVTLSIGAVATTVVNCAAGDTIVIRVANNRTAGATSLNTATGINHVEIEGIGN